MKSKAVLLGYYSANNFGDDIFCEVASWGVNHYWAKQARFIVPDLPIMPSDIYYHKPSKFRIKGQAIFYAYYESIFSDVIVYSGGSIFHSKPQYFYATPNLHYILSRLKKEIGAIGISVGPFKTQNDFLWIRKFLSKFSFITTRDKQSYEMLIDMHFPGKLIQSFDLAVLYPKILERRNYRKQSQPRNVVGVSLCHSERYAKGNIKLESLREENLYNAIKLLLDKKDDIRIRFFVLNGNPVNGDDEITESFIERLNNYKPRIEIVNYKGDPASVYDQINNCDLMLGIRLHSAIMAYSTGVPFLLCEYHPKCTYFLDEIHYPKEYRIGINALEPIGLYNRIEGILNQEPSLFISRLLPLDEAQNRALISFTEAPWKKVK